MAAKSITRRAVLATAAASAAATLPSPFVRGAFAAGKLSIGAWDHWVPGTGKVLGDICNAWAEKEKVDLTFDLITSNGDKDLLTLMAEGQAKAGHDIMGLRLWYVSAQKNNFVPVDDIVNEMIAKNGPISKGCEYTGKIDGHWMGTRQLRERCTAAVRAHRLHEGTSRDRRAKNVRSTGHAVRHGTA